MEQRIPPFSNDRGQTHVGEAAMPTGASEGPAVRRKSFKSSVISPTPTPETRVMSRDANLARVRADNELFLKVVGVAAGLCGCVIGAVPEDDIPVVHSGAALGFLTLQSVFNMVKISGHDHKMKSRTFLTILGFVSTTIFVSIMVLDMSYGLFNQRRGARWHLAAAITEWIAILSHVFTMFTWYFDTDADGKKVFNDKTRVLAPAGTLLTLGTIATSCGIMTLIDEKPNKWVEGIMMSDCGAYSPTKYIFTFGCIISMSILAFLNYHIASRKYKSTGVSLWGAAGAFAFLGGTEVLLVEMASVSFANAWENFGHLDLKEIMMAWIPIHYNIVFIGFAPPLYFYVMNGNEWSAPPFKYNPQRKDLLNYHVLPAFLWFVIGAAQVYLINEYPEWHLLVGVTVAVTVFGAFISTAMLSRAEKVSPLGDHVMYMEWWLGIASGLYLMMGLALITLSKHIIEPSCGALDTSCNEWVAFLHKMHKFSLSLCILVSTGPGVFRALRTTRELLSGRLNPGEYLKYKLYDQILLRRVKGESLLEYAPNPNDEKYIDQSLEEDESMEEWHARVKNFQDVESTYFVLAFLVTNFGNLIMFLGAGEVFHPAALFGLASPIVIIIRGYLKGLRFTWSMNYNFNVYKLNKMPEHVENMAWNVEDPMEGKEFKKLGTVAVEGKEFKKLGTVAVGNSKDILRPRFAYKEQ